MHSQKFDLKYSEVLQGDFGLEDLNMILVFQVNCPGCFAYALPLAIRLHEEYRAKGLNVLALSTAFEDFDLNTVGNTLRLLESGHIVGETRKVLEKAGYTSFPLKISFDVAFDLIAPNDPAYLEDDIKTFCTKHPELSVDDSEAGRSIKDQLKEYFLKKKFRAHTFSANHLSGTPSWILCDRTKNLLYESFGHKEYDRMVHIVEQFL
ncbi:MAG: hypothetical protein KA403_08045 [Candidatus Omnitrophica bacterium]|nr:hypothetical protein [Candidatus Omnitrophota bacterium]